MSLKLDELRKRLRQQPPSERVATESAPSATAAVAESSALPAARDAESSIIEPAENGAADASASSSRTDGPEAELAEAAAPIERPPSEASDVDPSATCPATAEPLSPPNAGVGENQIAGAVAAVFEQATSIQLRFEALSGGVAELARIGASAEEVIEPLTEFHAQIAELAESFAAMRSLQARLGRMAEKFEPMRALHDQMSQLADSIQDHVTEMVKTLEPAIEFRSRVLSLAGSLEGADALRERLGELGAAFHGDADTPLRAE